MLFVTPPAVALQAHSLFHPRRTLSGGGLFFACVQVIAQRHVVVVLFMFFARVLHLRVPVAHVFLPTSFSGHILSEFDVFLPTVFKAIMEDPFSVGPCNAFFGASDAVISRNASWASKLQCRFPLSCLW